MLAICLGNALTEPLKRHRQRKTLMPAFSNAAIRPLLPVFYDAVYKVSMQKNLHRGFLADIATATQMKTSWDVVIENARAEFAVIDVQKWFVWQLLLYSLRCNFHLADSSFL
jgi:hypothetical protein